MTVWSVGALTAERAAVGDGEVRMARAKWWR